MTRPNIVLVFIDDWAPARDHWFPFAHQSPFMPFLDMLRSRGVFLDRFQTEMACSPTRATALTGAHSNVHGLGKALKDGDVFAMDPTLPNLLRSMAEGGYRTTVLGKWHLADGTPESDWFHPIDCGAHELYGTVGNIDDYFDSDEWTHGVGSEGSRLQPIYSPVHSTQRIGLILQDLFRSEDDEPLFTWAGFHAPHAPFQPDTEGHVTATDDDVGKFLAMVEQIDSALSEWWGEITAEQRANTWILVCGDNGLPRAVAPDVFRPGKGTPWEAGIRNTLTAYHPNAVGAPGKRSSYRASVADLFATILDLAALEGAPPSSRSFAGILTSPNDSQVQSLRPVVSSKTEPFGADPATWTRVQQCAVSGTVKLHRTLERVNGEIQQTDEETFRVPTDDLQETQFDLDDQEKMRLHQALDALAGRPT